MDTATTQEVVSTGLPVWTAVLIAIIAATGPLVFNAIWKKLNGIESKEQDLLVSSAAANAVSGASSLVNELQTEREYLLRTVKELRVQVDELLLAKARADRLAEQVARLESDLIKARAERDAAHKENEDLRSRVEAAHLENTELAKRVEALEAELLELRGQLAPPEEN